MGALCNSDIDLGTNLNELSPDQFRNGNWQGYAHPQGIGIGING
jgi:hypothetical protein